MTKKRALIILFFLVIVIGVYPFGENEPIKYIERNTGEIKTEKVLGEYWLNWLYNNPLGELSLFAIVKRKFVSEWYGRKMDKPESANKIEDFVNEYNIKIEEAKKKEFFSFNDFFIRELKENARTVDTNKNIIISPADGKMLAYKNISNQDFILKGYKFNLQEFLADTALAKKYKAGSLLIIRLCPTDYHRYHFPVDGLIIEDKNIDGELYSVSPIALRKRVEIICQNKRKYTLIKTDKFGDIVMAEIGATMVGSMVRTYKHKKVKKAEEKGYFKFGGSTVVLIFEKSKIKIDEDLLENTEKLYETEIKMGERIGTLVI